MSAMADEPITLEFLARQQQRVLEEIGVMRDDMQVLTAMVMRLDGTVGLVLTELRAMHSQHQRLANRVRRLEEEPAEPK
jgi:hypothetical protein